MTAAVMLLRHIGCIEEGDRLEKAVLAADEKLGARMTGLADGGTCSEFADEVRAGL